MMILGAPGSGIDPLFQIDEKKKYIGFLEESDEEKSQSDEIITSDEEEEDGVNGFMNQIDKFHNRVKAEIKDASIGSSST